MQTKEEKEKIYKYYFWLDETIMDLWDQYWTIIFQDDPDDEKCTNKIQLINYYQKELDKLSEQVTFEEVCEYRNEHGLKPLSQRICDKIYLDPLHMVWLI